MPKVKILSDSTSDLSPELIERYRIGIVPLSINLGGRILKDGVEVTPSVIYDYVTKSGVLPGTVACTVGDFRDAFVKWTGEGYQIVCLTISSDMSSTFQNARIAAQGLENVYPVDSRNLSTGVGHLVAEAAVMAESGMEAPEIAGRLDKLVPKVRSSFILDNLAYMKKGGRCSSVMLLGANLMRIKPEIVVENGNMRLGRKFRGTLTKVLDDYVDARFAAGEEIRPERIFITHTGCSREIVDGVRARIESHMHFGQIIPTVAGSTVTSHSGPNTLGILYLVK